jgi:hypothetical protein
MSVAARFKIDQATKSESTEGVQVRLSAALDKGNEDWAKYTPAGHITMNVNGPAASWFEERLGQVLEITFDETPKENTP